MAGANEVKILVSGDNKSKGAFTDAEKDADKFGDALKKVGKRASDDLDKIGDSAKKTGKQIADIDDDARKTGKGLDDLGDKGKRAGDKIKDGHDKAGESAGGLKGRLESVAGPLEALGIVGGVVGAAIGAGMAVASAAVADLNKALDASFERAKIGAMIGAQGGGTDPARVAELGKTAGKVYADNFGDSLEEAGAAVRDVLRNHLLPEDATDDAVKRTTEKLLTISKVVEADSAEVARSVQQLIRTGMVKTADEAFDLIARGAQQGVDVAGDLLDTFDEYSTQFRKLGLDGKAALGLLSQGLQAGARDADTVADALKEFAIRAVDGSKTTADGFKSLGLNAKQMAADLASGGPKANAALDQTLDKLRAIKDPVERARIAVELFGTKAEDLGDALYGLDPSSAVRALGDVGGAADKASDALGRGLGNQIETFKRQAGQLLADVGDEIAPYVQTWIDNLQGFGSALSDIFAGSTVPQELKDSLRDIAEKYGPALKQAFSDIADKVRENKPELEELGHILANDVIPFIGGALVDGLHAATFAVEGVISVVSFMVKSWNFFHDTVPEIIDAFELKVAEMFLTIADFAADAFGWVPGIGDKLNAARDKIRKFVDQTNADLDRLHDADVYVYFHAVGDAAALAAGASAIGAAGRGGRRTGGPTSSAATGGPRDGLTMVGEDGPELARLPAGTMVYPHANTAQMAAMGDHAGRRIEVELRITGNGATYEMLHAAQRSGDLQILASAIVDN